MAEDEAAPKKHSITSEGLATGAVRACWAVAVLLMAAGITATFIAGTGAAPASMILFGSLFLVLALMKRVPLSLEVGGAKFDASYEVAEAFDRGRETGLQQGFEVALNDVDKAEESGQSPHEALERRRDLLVDRFWSTLAHQASTTDGGYPAAIACQVARITLRQLDYWARTGLVTPSGRGRDGRRLYSTQDIVLLTVIKRLLDTGVSLQQIRVAISHVRATDLDALDHITLLSDGESVYEARSADEVIDLVESGEGIFGIAVGRVRREVLEALAEVGRG